MKSNWFKGVGIVLLVGFFMQCEVANNSSTQEPANETEQIKQQFNLKLFEDILPQNSSIDWSSSKKAYSEKLETMYTEFPISYERISASGSGITKKTSHYSIITVQEESGYTFYLAKFLSKTSISENQNVMLSNANNFTGIAMLLNSDKKAEYVFDFDKGKVKATGAQISKQKYEDFKSGKYKMSVDCYPETVHHYTDWYQEYSDGTIVKIFTEYHGSTTTEVCYEDPPTGSGGGGGGDSGSSYDEYIYKRFILIDDSILNNPKVRCIAEKLLLGNAFPNTIFNFADESVDIELIIELVEVSNNDPGSLYSTSANDIFRLQIDGSRAQARLPIQIATTFLHEAIHAEMRRYLYGANNTSTLPGFPGNFADDWEAYVRTQNGKDLQEQVSNAEHNTMAEKYIDIIIDGLREFDNNLLTDNEYEALAWEGLVGTIVWNNLDQAKRNQLGTGYQTAINSSNSSCN